MNFVECWTAKQLALRAIQRCSNLRTLLLACARCVYRYSTVDCLDCRSANVLSWWLQGSATQQDVHSGSDVELCAASSSNHSVVLSWRRADNWGPGLQAMRELMVESSLLLVNWGVHYANDTQTASSLEVFSAAVKEHWVGRGKSAGSIFWRATVVAHEECSDAALPLQQSTSVWDDHTAGQPSFHARDILRQDRTMCWPTVRALGARILRVDAMTGLRLDGHRLLNKAHAKDCLHYCEPGIPDTWAMLLFNSLVGQIVP